VSHNVSAIQTLCNRGIYLERGGVACIGDVDPVCRKYLGEGLDAHAQKTWIDIEDSSANDRIKLHSIQVVSTEDSADIFTVKTPILIEFSYSLYIADRFFYVGVHVKTISGQCAFVTVSFPELISPGRYRTVCHIPGNLLNAELYTLHVYFVCDSSDVLYEIENPVTFEVHDVERPEGAWIGPLPGAVRPQLKWETSLQESI
jgi:lipopolysaccharide transport system ATP-binding protein